MTPKILLIASGICLSLVGLAQTSAPSTSAASRSTQAPASDRSTQKSAASILAPGPSIEEVAAKFYNAYDNYNENIVVSFEKRKRQWRVGAQRFEGKGWVTLGSYLFYDSDSGGYQKLPILERSDTSFVDFRQKIDDYTLGNYHIHSYYGYDGWYKDVIADLAGKEGLSDSAQYSLARAYSSYASCLLMDQLGYAIKSEVFDMPMARNCMSAVQRKKYADIESKAIDCFGRLCKQNPDFETIVGKIGVKYANEVMVEFYTYLTYADEYAATYALPDHLYPDSVITSARRILDNCPPDAILLSFGDNDLYAILYVQQKFGLRKDVYLINDILIAMGRYIFRAQQPQLQARPVKISVGYPQYEGHTNDYLSLGDSTRAMACAEVIDTILHGHANDAGVLSLPAKTFVVKLRSAKNRRGNNDKVGDGVDDGVDHRVDDTVHITSATPYILKNDWILLDILNNLHGRKFCSESPMEGFFAPLNKYFVKKDEHLFVY